MHYRITDFLADIVENALDAGSGFTEIKIIQDDGNLKVSVKDTGKGMTEAEILRARDPFGTDGKKHPGRRVGLGIPFLVQALNETGGDFSISSRPGAGTTVSFRFDLRHLDTPPLGSLPETFRQILSLPGSHDMAIHRALGTESYDLSRRELLETLEDLESVGSLAILEQYLESLEDSVQSPEKGARHGKNDP